MPALPTPLVRLRALDGRGTLFAKLESLHPSGSIYDRVAARVVARAAGADPLVIHGDAPWCLALFAAAARAGRGVVAFVVAEPAVAEHLVLLRDTRIPVRTAPMEALEVRARDEAGARGAAVLPLDASADFAVTLGAELVAQVAELPAPARIVAPDDGHGLVAGLRACGLEVIGVAAEHSRIGLCAATRGEAVAGPVAQATRARAARLEGLLIGHSSAAVLSVAIAARAATVVALVVDAGDRVFSLDVEVAA